MSAPADASDAPRHPGVRFPPPLLYAAAWLLGWWLHARVTRLPITGRGALHGPLAVAGAAMLVAGLALIGWGMLTFARARTAILPNRPASRVVAGGPYRFTRNPMYVGMATMYAGAALAADTWWPLPFLPLVLLGIWAWVIRREERYLAAAFGGEYDAYRRRVRRWL